MSIGTVRVEIDVEDAIDSIEGLRKEIEVLRCIASSAQAYIGFPDSNPLKEVGRVELEKCLTEYYTIVHERGMRT